MNIQESQQKLFGIISDIAAGSNDETLETKQNKALEVINKLKDHINDKIEIHDNPDNPKMTILDMIIYYDSKDGVRLNNKLLLDLESAVKNIGGKTSQELERNANHFPTEQDDLPSTKLEDVTIEPAMSRSNSFPAQ